MNDVSDSAPELTRPTHQEFELKLEKLLEEAERMRVRLMKKYQSRHMTAVGVSIFSVFALGAVFGWFFLIETQILVAILAIIVCTFLVVYMHIWADKPLRAYESQYKTMFLPQLARLLGGLKFFPSRGISANILQKTGVVPKHGLYRAEDCFMGRYKGVKVIFSEGRLYPEKKPGSHTVFDGIFVLLECPEDKFKGHTILTSDMDMVEHYAHSRWKSLQPVPAETDEHYDPAFKLFSNSPETATNIISKELFKELGEASDIFNEAPVTLVFFQKKYIFMMIETDQNMFEPCSIQLPIKTNLHGVECKKEIDQILEIIDIFDLYKPKN